MTKLARAARHTDLVRLMLPPEEQAEAEVEAQVAALSRDMQDSAFSALTNGTLAPNAWSDEAIGPLREAMRRTIAETQAVAEGSRMHTQNELHAARWWGNATLGRQIPRDAPLRAPRERARVMNFATPYIPLGYSPTWGESPLRYIPAPAPARSEPQDDRVDALSYAHREIEFRRSALSGNQLTAFTGIGRRLRRP